MDAIAVRPVSVAIDAGGIAFQTYKTGVLTTTSGCENTELNHAVQAVGYMSTDTIPYYIVRNSWGAGWGDKGYVNIEMTPGGKGDLGACGINQEVWTVSTVKGPLEE